MVDEVFLKFENIKFINKKVIKNFDFIKKFYKITKLFVESLLFWGMAKR